MKNNKKSSLFAKGMALFLALLMIASVVFTVVAYLQAAWKFNGIMLKVTHNPILFLKIHFSVIYGLKRGVLM